MSYRVVVSEQVKGVLEGLHRSDRTRSRELALLLLRLEKDARPDGSRQLDVGSSKKGKSAREERVWDGAGFRIAYRVTGSRRLVEVAIVTRSR